jgi:hypothetical protein
MLPPFLEAVGLRLPTWNMCTFTVCICSFSRSPSAAHVVSTSTDIFTNSRFNVNTRN